MKAIKPLFMWAGGKTKMVPKYSANPGFPTDFTSYCEPFFGGGAVFCHLYNLGQLDDKDVWINDGSIELASLYLAIQEDVEAFIGSLKTLENSYLCLSYEERKKLYYRMRDDYAFSSALDPATFYFLLKTSFNGIVQKLKGSDRFGSPCGLLNHKEKLFDYDLIRSWHRALRGVWLGHGDWSVISYGALQQDKPFIYLDPPYRASFTHYANDEVDHEHIIRFVRESSEVNSKSTVWLSNRWTDDGWYEPRLGELKMETYPVTYTAGRRKKNEDGTHSAVKAIEVLIHNGD